MSTIFKKKAPRSLVYPACILNTRRKLEKSNLIGWFKSFYGKSKSRICAYYKHFETRHTEERKHILSSIFNPLTAKDEISRHEKFDLLKGPEVGTFV